ncbi:MAG: hypothetical protein QXL34_04100 [Thermosphaera sp.]
MSSLFDYDKALKMLSRITSGIIRLLLTKYPALLSRGMALCSLRDRTSNAVETSVVDVNRAVQSRIMLGLVLTTGLSLLQTLSRA